MRPQNRIFAKGAVGFALAIASLVLYSSGCSVDELFEVNKERILGTVGKCDPNNLNECPSDECNDGFCDSKGVCQKRPIEPARVFKTGPCFEEKCINGVRQIAVFDVGETCNGSSGVCNKKQECVICTENNINACGSGTNVRCLDGDCASCSNGQQDMDEDGVDCGGKCANVCIALAQPCNSNGSGEGSSCKSGNCVNNVCCDLPCTGKCQACNLFGSVGTCTSIPLGEMGNCPDDSSKWSISGCDDMEQCQIIGGNGQFCISKEGCLSGACIYDNNQKLNFCKKTEGSCETPKDCASGKCDSAKQCVPYVP